MGTRSLTIFRVLKTEYEDAEDICVMYRQFDGYPEGHGKELATFLKDMVMVNGLRLKEERRVANGMGCLAAQIIANFKQQDAGNIYLFTAGTKDVWEQYTYIVTGKEGEEPHIEIQDVYDNHKVLFKGSATDCLKWIESECGNEK